jgi:hypothetical protein
MAVLPDKILEDAEINAFIDRVNDTADSIVSDSKFKIPNSNLFGLGLLIKLQIRTFERSLATAFAPIFMGKKIMSSGIREIRETLSSIRTLFSNPLQFMLDEGINEQLKEFPFPISLNLADVGGDIGRLKSLINSSSPDNVDDELDRFSYSITYNINQAPSDGQITTTSSGIENLTSINVSEVTDVEDNNGSLGLLKSGDEIEVSSDGKYGVFEVTSVRKINSSDPYYRIDLEIKSLNVEEVPGDGSVVIPGFSSASLRSSRRLALRDFTSNGKISIPFSVLGLSFPGLSRINLVLGDFSDVSPDSPTRQYLDQLSNQSGIAYDEVLSGVFEGKFPKIDFTKIQETTLSGSPDLTESSKEDLVSFARVLQIGAENPFFLIRILLNYLKLLLLPIKVILGVLKGLAGKITNPISLIRTVIKGLTDPLGLICDLISEAFLQFLEPYISPAITTIMPYEEAKVDPSDSNRGLKPLISDMVCGAFSRGLSSYQPNGDFFDSIRGQIKNEDLDTFPVTFPYSFRGELIIPEEGQISANSRNVKDITTMRVSLVSDDVKNSLGSLINVNSGDLIRLSVDSDYSVFRVSYRKVENKYVEYGVLSDVKESDYEGLSDIEKIIRGINQSEFESYLTVDNPNKVSLYIIEKYLPIKLIGVWESIKGIIAVVGGLAAEVPSLFPAVVRSLFGIGSPGEGAGLSDLTVESINEVLDLLVTNKTNSWYWQGTKKGTFGSYSSDDRDLWYSITYDIDGNSPIETFFYDLSDQLMDNGMSTSVYKNKLPESSSATGSSFYNIPIGDAGYVYEPLYPVRSSFYWGERKLTEIGDSVKVFLAVLYTLRDDNLNDLSVLSLENAQINIPGVDSDGNKNTLFSGSVRTALNRYRVINSEYPDLIESSALRIRINREFYLIRYLIMPSVME